MADGDIGEFHCVTECTEEVRLVADIDIYVHFRNVYGNVWSVPNRTQAFLSRTLGNATNASSRTQRVQTLTEALPP